jgi:type VI secretion system secreted protein Hcp
MAVDMYLKMDPVKGESRGKDHVGEIDITSFSWGGAQPHLGHSGGGTGAGRVDIHDLDLTHYVDKSTPVLWQSLCENKHFDKAILTCRKAGEKPLDYLIITLEKVSIASVTSHGHGGGGAGDHPTESFTLHFQKFTVKYQEQNDKGGVASSPDFNYNITERA